MADNTRNFLAAENEILESTEILRKQLDNAQALVKNLLNASYLPLELEKEAKGLLESSDNFVIILAQVSRASEDVTDVTGTEAMASLLKEARRKVSELIDSFGDAQETDKVMASLTSLNEFLALWEWETSAFRPTETRTPEQEGSETVEEYEEPQDLSIGDTSPLEEAVKRTHPKSSSSGKMPLELLIAWSFLYQAVGSSLNHEAGSAQSVHLYRERKAPLHHEFAIISFGGEGVRSSWLRLERAARLKHRFFQHDSFGPIFRGATVRETVTFANSRDTLLPDPVDELASVTLQKNRRAEPSEAPIYFAELLALISAVSDGSPKYTLLSFNCRWFARRLVLDFAERLRRVMSSGYSASWRQGNREVKVTYDALLESIRQDLFGGRRLVDKNVAEIRALQTMQLARANLEKNNLSRALELCDEALPTIRALSTQSSSQLFRYSQSLELRYGILTLLLRHEDALEAISESRSIIDALISSETLLTPARQVRNRHALASTMTLVANNLTNLQRLDEALAVQLQAVALWRVLSREYRHADGQISAMDGGLARSLYQLVALYVLMNNAEEAAKISQEAVDIFSSMHTVFGDTFRGELASALQSHSNVLNILGHVEGATKTISEAVRLYRTVFGAYPDSYRSDMRDVMYDQAMRFESLERWEDACESIEESIIHGTRLFRDDPDRWRAVMANSLLRSGVYHTQAGKNSEAISRFESALQLYRTLFAKDPEGYREDLEAVLDILVQFEVENSASYVEELGSLFPLPGSELESRREC